MKRSGVVLGLLAAAGVAGPAAARPGERGAEVLLLVGWARPVGPGSDAYAAAPAVTLAAATRLAEGASLQASVMIGPVQLEVHPGVDGMGRWMWLVGAGPLLRPLLPSDPVDVRIGPVLAWGRHTAEARVEDGAARGRVAGVLLGLWADTLWTPGEATAVGVGGQYARFMWARKCVRRGEEPELCRSPAAVSGEGIGALQAAVRLAE